MNTEPEPVRRIDALLSKIRRAADAQKKLLDRLDAGDELHQEAAAEIRRILRAWTGQGPAPRSRPGQSGPSESTE